MNALQPPRKLGTKGTVPQHRVAPNLGHAKTAPSQSGAGLSTTQCADTGSTHYGGAHPSGSCEREDPHHHLCLGWARKIQSLPRCVGSFFFVGSEDGPRVVIIDIGAHLRGS